MNYMQWKNLKRSKFYFSDIKILNLFLFMNHIQIYIHIFSSFHIYISNFMKLILTTVFCTL